MIIAMTNSMLHSTYDKGPCFEAPDEVKARHPVLEWG